MATEQTQPFQQFNLNKQLLDAIGEAGYRQPTPIQQKAIPAILGGQDVIGVAQTGTGKTAAFVLPLLKQLGYAQGEHARALILAPTRELAMQIEEHVRLLSKNLDIRSVVLYGGIGPTAQIEQLQRGVDIIVATPGRFLDLYLSGHLVTRSIKHMVMDEADKMMDMGFISKLHRILEVVPKKRQNMLFSATMSDLVHKISGDFLEFPTIIETSEQATPAETIDQILYEVPNHKTKINLLRHLFDQSDFERCIIFCRTRTAADQVFNFLERHYGKEHVRVIHANKGQNTRINSMNAFKTGEIRFLVATDVAARGLDVSNVSHVVNFDVPIVVSDYVHRIGRTGRAMNMGVAITFCNPAEVYVLREIEKLTRQSIPTLPIPVEVFVEETPYKEKQEVARAVDAQKRKENPDFQGAFHEKKFQPRTTTKGKNVSGSRAGEARGRFSKGRSGGRKGR